jgi:hypothetical protein
MLKRSLIDSQKEKKTIKHILERSQENECFGHQIINSYNNDLLYMTIFVINLFLYDYFYFFLVTIDFIATKLQAPSWPLD